MVKGEIVSAFDRVWFCDAKASFVQRSHLNTSQKSLFFFFKTRLMEMEIPQDDAEMAQVRSEMLSVLYSFVLWRNITGATFHCF